ncbi:SHOCT domain-containing protein [Nocardioides sp. NPDC006273]|uniref:SHOCT domain-containing protein n=1 Tax=Nocardioides sp. NPDC006273 TaxID=3155598 RepID=UPI0033A8C70C
MSINETMATLAVTGDGWGPWRETGPWHDGGGPPAFWPIFPLLWFLVIAAIITAIVVFGSNRAAEGPRRAGEARLAERYAAGEIDENEYRARRDVLRQKPGRTKDA